MLYLLGLNIFVLYKLNAKLKFVSSYLKL